MTINPKTPSIKFFDVFYAGGREPAISYGDAENLFGSIDGR